MLPAGIPSVGWQNQRNDSNLRHFSGKKSRSLKTGTGIYRRNLKTAVEYKKQAAVLIFQKQWLFSIGLRYNGNRMTEWEWFAC
jgi:hypothetical protein